MLSQLIVLSLLSLKFTSGNFGEEGIKQELPERKPLKVVTPTEVDKPAEVGKPVEVGKLVPDQDQFNKWADCLKDENKEIQDYLESFKTWFFKEGKQDDMEVNSQKLNCGTELIVAIVNADLHVCGDLMDWLRQYLEDQLDNYVQLIQKDNTISVKSTATQILNLLKKDLQDLTSKSDKAAVLRSLNNHKKTANFMYSVYAGTLKNSSS